MSERVERMVKEYPSMVMERDCLRHQLANFQGITEEEVIDSMTFSSPEGERVQTSNITDKTASIAISFRDRVHRINRDWIDHLTVKLLALEEEIDFFHSAIRAISPELAPLMWDLTVERLTWMLWRQTTLCAGPPSENIEKRPSASWMHSTPPMTRRWRTTYCDRRQQKCVKEGTFTL